MNKIKMSHRALLFEIPHLENNLFIENTAYFYEKWPMSKENILRYNNILGNDFEIN